MGNRFGAWRGALGVVVGAAVLSGAPCAAWADTLSLVTSWNLDGSKGSWWVGDAASPADEAMRDGSAPVGGRWRNPEGVQLAAQLSKVFLRHDLSVNNGRALAGVYGATHALVGHVQWEVAEGVSFVGLQAVRARLNGTWVVAADQSTLGSYQVAVTGFGQTLEEAEKQAGALLELEVRRSKPAAQSAAPPSLGVGEDELVVEVKGPASAYVAFLRRLRELDKGIIDFGEVWATEGTVCLHLELDEETPDLRITRALEGLVNTAQEGFTLSGLKRSGNRVVGLVVGAAAVSAPSGR
jgi:hypothetical protein